MSEIKLVHYRNGVFQGQIKSNKKNGKGILITDEGQIVVGMWKNDRLFGNVLMFLSQQQYSFGEFNRGQLQGLSKFESNDQILLSQFNASKPINKQLLLDKNEHSFKVTSPLPTSIFECLKQQSLSQGLESLQQLSLKETGSKYPKHVNNTLIEYLTQYYKNDQFYETEVLNNGYFMFKIRDEASVVSLGFVINKNNQLVSYGSYVNSKLHGLGCKYQNTLRYEGIFQNGFLNGYGLKCALGKYSYGLFQNGTLTSPVYLQQRSLASEEKLKQLKKLTHMTDLNFSNIYLPQNQFKFKGTKEIIFQLPLKQDNLISKMLAISTPSKKSINLVSKLLINKDQPQMKSSISVFSKAKGQSRLIEGPKSPSLVNTLSRFRNN